MGFPTTTPTGDTPKTADETQAPLYTDGSASLDEYDFFPGVCVLPLAEDPPTELEALKAWSPVAVMRLHAPYRLRNASSRAVKSNNPPMAPAPADGGKFVFVGGSLTVHNTLNQTLNNYDWTVTTEFTFVENCVSRVEDGFVLGAAPWVWKTTIDNQNSTLYGGTISLGAVSAAGRDAQLGYFQALAALPNLSGRWRYNSPTFYPGVFMNAEMDNGGKQTVP